MTRSFLTALAAAGIFSSTASAATIAYGTVTDISGDTDVSTVGTNEYAYNFNTSSTGGTVNGVTFGSLAGPGNTDVALTVAGTTGAAFSPAPVTAGTVSADYAGLLGGGTFKGAAAGNITLQALTIGTVYQVQLFSYRSNDGNRISQFDGVSVDGNANAAPPANGSGQYVIGTFTADAVSQVIDLAGSDNFAVQNGLSLRVVPEPASLALLGLGGLAMIGRRRKG